ncbi:hypothetical protein [Rhizobium gallicum]|uniref:hypothetical protein n=1 Tax=Rhizobium gallicum TaxID=56730 RepID=UPI001EF89367|nr:hypothetical protein [Rhizobium gallicum]ULJ70626.1 hypothetical protein L2W42_11710 [Rhizobium gallicum]
MLVEGIPPDKVIDVGDLQLSLVDDEEEQELIPDRLAHIVPAQKISPVRFTVLNGLLAIAHTPAEPVAEDRNGTLSARSSLIERGKEILEELRASNCDRRFLSELTALQGNLESSYDIVQLGIINLGCDDQRKAFEAELSTAIATKLRSHLTSISMYVAQFPEWQKFVENAAAVELNEEDVRRSQSIVHQLASDFEGRPDAIDPEVPRTLRMISDAISDPAQAGKRLSFALIRTVENLCISLIETVSKFSQETVIKSSKMGSFALATTFSAFILKYTGALTALSDGVPGMGWLKSALEIMMKSV